jgi:hypothetical protein
LALPVRPWWVPVRRLASLPVSPLPQARQPMSAAAQLALERARPKLAQPHSMLARVPLEQ